MGFWAGIKYALNSRLGQSDFKPLDKILEDSFYITPSNTFLKKMYSRTSPEGVSDIPYVSIGVSNIKGTMRLNVLGLIRKQMSENNQAKFYFAVGNNVTEHTVTLTGTGDVSFNFSIDVYVDKGTYIQFSADAYDYYNSIISVSVNACGTVMYAPDKGIII